MHACVCVRVCIDECVVLWVWTCSRVYVFKAERKTDKPELQDRWGWKGFSHMLCPDKAHLFGLGLPLPPSLSIGAAGFIASGLSQLRWVSMLQMHNRNITTTIFSYLLPALILDHSPQKKWCTKNVLPSSVKSIFS